MPADNKASAESVDITSSAGGSGGGGVGWAKWEFDLSTATTETGDPYWQPSDDSTTVGRNAWVVLSNVPAGPVLMAISAHSDRYAELYAFAGTPDQQDYTDSNDNYVDYVDSSWSGTPPEGSARTVSFYHSGGTLSLMLLGYDGDGNTVGVFQFGFAHLDLDTDPTHWSDYVEDPTWKVWSKAERDSGAWGTPSGLTAPSSLFETTRRGVYDVEYGDNHPAVDTYEESCARGNSRRGRVKDNNAAGALKACEGPMPLDAGTTSTSLSSSAGVGFEQLSYSGAPAGLDPDGGPRGSRYVDQIVPVRMNVGSCRSARGAFAPTWPSDYQAWECVSEDGRIVSLNGENPVRNFVLQYLEYGGYVADEPIAAWDLVLRGLLPAERMLHGSGVLPDDWSRRSETSLYAPWQDPDRTDVDLARVTVDVPDSYTLKTLTIADPTPLLHAAERSVDGVYVIDETQRRALMLGYVISSLTIDAYEHPISYETGATLRALRRMHTNGTISTTDYSGTTGESTVEWKVVTHRFYKGFSLAFDPNEPVQAIKWRGWGVPIIAQMAPVEASTDGRFVVVHNASFTLIGEDFAGATHVENISAGVNASGGSMAVNSDRIVTMQQNGNLYALDLATGAQVGYRDVIWDSDDEFERSVMALSNGNFLLQSAYRMASYIEVDAALATVTYHRANADPSYAWYPNGNSKATIGLDDKIFCVAYNSSAGNELWIEDHLTGAHTVQPITIPWGTTLNTGATPDSSVTANLQNCLLRAVRATDGTFWCSWTGTEGFLLTEHAADGSIARTWQQADFGTNPQADQSWAMEIKGDESGVYVGMQTDSDDGSELGAEGIWFLPKGAGSPQRMIGNILEIENYGARWPDGILAIERL